MGMPVGATYGWSSARITLARRNASGSAPSSRATCSIISSRAVVSIIHGPRYAALPQVLVHTWLVLQPTAPMRYGPLNNMPTSAPALPPTG